MVRLNMSHIKINKLKKTIKFIKKNSKIPICLDTEGAQIRTKIRKTYYYKYNQKITIKPSKGNFNFYPVEVYNKIKKGDKLEIGFNNLKIKILKKNKNYILAKTISPGLLEENKGVHLINRNINLKYLTKKDLLAIEIAKEFKINNFALSFTNSTDDIKNFNRLLPKSNKIYKIETKRAIKSFTKIIKHGKHFLIDRGDLSKDITPEKVPLIQRKIFSISNKNKSKKIYIATNLLESMVLNRSPSRGEANDIFSSLEMGASGLVLAAETAIGKYPEETILFLKKIIKVFKKN